MPPRKQMDNNNPKPEIERILRTVLENLRELAHTPSKLMFCSKTFTAGFPSSPVFTHVPLSTEPDVLLCKCALGGSCDRAQSLSG